jgi:hypothetical protein
MYEPFPFAHIIAGILILIVGFGFHFLSQLMGYLHWEPEVKHGFIINMPVKSKGYAHIIALSDVLIGWSYAIIGSGLYLGKSWGYVLAWIPGIIFTFEGIGYWFWSGHQQRFKDPLRTRIEWSTLNIICGLFIVLVAWSGIN